MEGPPPLPTPRLVAAACGRFVRALAAQYRPVPEGKYAINFYLKERGDSKFRSGEDIHATKAFSGENDHLRTALGAKAEMGPANDTIHTLRIQTAIRRSATVEIASAYEATTKHRIPPKGFGPLKDEP